VETDRDKNGIRLAGLRLTLFAARPQVDWPRPEAWQGKEEWT
jgi:hypothetical protein